MSKPGLLVLCTGNSCRSQMAEALLRKHAGDRFTVYSAGTEPADDVHPMAREVMAEVGDDLSGQEPKHFQGMLGRVPIHTILIVCDGADKACPAVWPGAYDRLFWPFDDPATFEGDEESTRATFRQTRDAIEAKVVEWVEAGFPGEARPDPAPSSAQSPRSASAQSA